MPFMLHPFRRFPMQYAVKHNVGPWYRCTHHGPRS